MDISYWINLNPKTKILPTDKIKFSKYTAAAKYYVPGGAYLRSANRKTEYYSTPQEYIHFRITSARNYKALGSWHGISLHSLLDADSEVIGHFYDALIGSGIRYRIEEPYITIYAEDEATLKQHTQLLNAHCKLLETVTVAASAEDEQLLAQNYIFMRNNNGYTHKVTLRDNWYQDKNVTHQLTNYLMHLGDSVQISRSVSYTLGIIDGNPKGFWNVWFYTKDTSFLPMLDLIKPNIVLKINPIAIR